MNAKLCECLIGRIALSPLCTEEDRCDYYIDKLPGIKRSKFEHLTDQDRETYLQIVRDIEDRSIQSLYATIFPTLTAAFKTRSVVKDIRSGYWKQPFTALPAANEYRGEYIDLRGSDYTEVYIESVHIGVSAGSPLTVEVRIYDIEQPALLDSFSQLAPTNDFVNIPIGRSYRADRIWISYDANLVQSYETTNYDSAYYDQICEPCHCSTSSRCASLDQTDGIQYDNLVFGSSNCSGMVVKYQIICSVEAWICKHQNQVLQMLYYLMGIEFFIELLASERINCSTLISVEKLDALMGYCQQKYDSLIEGFSNTIQPDDPTCFLCRSRVSKATINF